MSKVVLLEEFRHRKTKEAIQRLREEVATLKETIRQREILLRVAAEFPQVIENPQLNKEAVELLYQWLLCDGRPDEWETYEEACLEILSRHE